MTNLQAGEVVKMESLNERAMTPYECLLRAIVEDPFNYQARLVMADWLEENGSRYRAEFIRAQIQLQNQSSPLLKKLTRRGQRLHQQCLKWPKAIVATWRRGFVEAIATDIDLWVIYGPGIVLEQPIANVRLKRFRMADIWHERHKSRIARKNPVAWARQVAGLPTLAAPAHVCGPHLGNC